MSISVPGIDNLRPRFAPSDARFILQVADPRLPLAQVLAALHDGILYVKTSTGILTSVGILGPAPPTGNLVTDNASVVWTGATHVFQTPGGVTFWGDAPASIPYITFYDVSSGTLVFLQGDVAGLTANRTITIPDVDITLIGRLETVTVSNKTMAVTTKLIVSSIGTGAHFQDSVTISKVLYVRLAGATGTNGFDILGNARTYTFPNEVTPFITVKCGTDVNLTNQSADIGATNLTTAPAPGMYRVVYVLECTTADNVTPAGTVTFNVTSTDDVGSHTDSSPALALTATGRTSGSIKQYVASGNPQYTISHTGVYGTSKYALRVRTEALG